MTSTAWADVLRDWPLRCPACMAGDLREDDIHGALQITCPACQNSFPIENGVAALVDFTTRPELLEFTQSYQSIRASEGYTGRGAEYYRRLPMHPPKEPDSDIWRIRQKSFAAFRKILTRAVPAGGTVLDLGSGNGWLSHQTALLGYRPMGMDINTDPDDGLAAVRHYPLQWPVVMASFDQLPLADGGVDMAVFNGSLHYSERVEDTLAETFRVLRPGGTLVILDTPIYWDSTSGDTMMAQRKAHHQRTHGQANTYETEGYLTWNAVLSWSDRFGCRTNIIRPWYGLAWALRPMKARVLRRREPASFAVIELTKR